jgi:hypothetical protein
MRFILFYFIFAPEPFILSGVEAMHMMKKGQLHRQVKSIQNELKFIHKLSVIEQTV